jgi:hypothetical protein
MGKFLLAALALPLVGITQMSVYMVSPLTFVPGVLLLVLVVSLFNALGVDY